MGIFDQIKNSVTSRYFQTTAGITLGAIVAMTPLFAHAGPDGQHHGFGPGKGPILRFLESDELSLTSGQKNSIKSVLETHKTAFKADRQAMRTAGKNLFSYLKGGGSDASQIDQLTTASSAAMKTLQTEEARTFIDAYAVLTPDQKTTLASQASDDAEHEGSHGGHCHHHK